MRSEREWNHEWIDLPSLTSFKGDENNFEYIGSVILKSSHLVTGWISYPSIIIQWNPIRRWLLHLHQVPPIFKYSFSHFIIFRCYCSRISHQRQKRICLWPSNPNWTTLSHCHLSGKTITCAVSILNRGWSAFPFIYRYCVFWCYFSPVIHSPSTPFKEWHLPVLLFKSLYPNQLNSEVPIWVCFSKNSHDLK